MNNCTEVLSIKKGKQWLIFYSFTVSSILLAAHFVNRAATVMAENAPIEQRQCIVVDAGHGGEDGGATSCTGIQESTYNLEIAKQLNDLLNFLGYDTRMIRTADVSVYTKGETIAQKKISDLKERVRIVNETENALLLSIHQNTFSDSRSNGAQVFYAGTKGSEELARNLQFALTSCLNPHSNRMIKKSNGIYLMDHINKTGVLIECGFLSNPEEEAKLRNPKYQQKISCIIAASVSEFLSNT